MQTVVGIDEAGYSPLLGPLVITAACFEVRTTHKNWWAALGIPTARGNPRLPALPAVDDSKKLYAPNRGVGKLEEGVLAFLKAAGRHPASLRQLLACVGCEADTEGYPWYREADVAIPVAAGPEAIDPAAAELGRAFERSGVRFTGFRSAPLLAGDFNTKVQARGNKSLVLFHSAMRLVDGFIVPGKPLQVLADKQGARNYYAQLLSQYFFGCRLQRVVEGKELSTYRISHGGRRLDISFCLKGDSAHLPIALASMCSKYIRELFMVLFNRYWNSVKPGMGRTSGYQVDGRRFIRGISALPQFAEIPRNLIIRQK